MKNTLTHIVNYEKTIFDKKNNMKSATWRPSYKKSSNILRSKKASSLKTSQNIIYLKKYFSMFFFTLKDIKQA